LGSDRSSALSPGAVRGASSGRSDDAGSDARRQPPEEQGYAGPDRRADQDAFAAQMGGVELLSEEELLAGRQASADRRQTANDEVLDFIHQLGHEMGGEGMMGSGAADLAAAGGGGVVSGLIEATEAALDAAATAATAAEGSGEAAAPAEPALL
jgi:hypothetical protein